jgi:hypothetical protein
MSTIDFASSQQGDYDFTTVLFKEKIDKNK